MNKSDYLLTLIEEEALEIAHRACKARRFGLMEIQSGQGYNNAERLKFELNDLYAVLRMFHMEQPLFGIKPDNDQIQKHIEQVLTFMAYSKKLGLLD